jgi:hypothetical protein
MPYRSSVLIVALNWDDVAMSLSLTEPLASMAKMPRPVSDFPFARKSSPPLEAEKALLPEFKISSFFLHPVEACHAKFICEPSWTSSLLENRPKVEQRRIP